MSLLEERYRKIDPEGIINMAFVNTETKGFADGARNGISTKEKTGKSLLEANFVKSGEKQPEKEVSMAVSYHKLFRFATKGDILLIFIAIICATLSAVSMPYGLVLYGEFTTLFVDREVNIGPSTPTTLLRLFGGGAVITNATPEQIYEETMKDSRAFGIGMFSGAVFQLIFGALSIDILNRTAQKQITKLRKQFLQSVLRQDMTWYDLNTSDNFAVKITDDLDKMKEGIGEKLAIFAYLMMSFFVSVIVSMFYGWKLTLVILSCAPLIILSTAFVAKMQASLSVKELKSYSRAGTVAEEVLGSIRTVVAFGGEKKELERYSNRLEPAELNGKKKGLFSGVGGGLMWFIIYCIYALAFWYGISLIIADRGLEDKEYTPVVLIIVLFGVLMGAQNFGLAAPHLEAFNSARGSAVSIFKVIDRVPQIDSLGELGKKPKIVDGKIKFSNVWFRYPARNDVQVLNGLDLEIEAGKTVALVGPSGCGKSTCLQLIQNLYNPLKGSVFVDDVKIPEWNTRHLRSFIGVVGQEPVLFAATIRENIRYGNPSVTNEEIEKAARISNCHQFIMKLPDGYETKIGERGAQLSGGQKQRISIARALVKNPKILLLDEATSALDPHSEKRVQDALERASKNRTTVVVSHRLSTITNSDKIVYINKGVVVEQGTHQELMQKKGFYFELVSANNSKISENDSNESLQRSMRTSKSKSFNGDSDEDADSDTEKESIEEEISEEDKKKVSTIGLMKLNSKEWPQIVSGTLASCIMGATFPVFAVLLGEMYGVLSLSDPEAIQSGANFYSLMFIVLGVVAGFSTFIQTYMFNYAGVKLTSRLRTMTFDAMMRQEMSWFDDAKNAVGALCARLAGDCASVQGATGTRVGSMVQAGSVIFLGIGISLYYNWKITLVASISIPLVLLSIMMEARLIEKSNLKEKIKMETATKMAVEAISNIRTVASLGQEPHVLNRYIKEIDRIHNLCVEKSRYRGLVFTLGQTMPIMSYGFSLWYGGTLVANKEMAYENVIKVGEALIFGSWMLGQALAYAPNVNNAVVSASRIMKLLKRTPNQSNPQPQSGVDYDKTSGKIVFKDVGFRYPTRRSVQVLEKLNLTIEPGKTVALVGPSGCGKSTCMQLILRYYDPEAGVVELDDMATVDYPLGRIRAKMGLVSQEPILFDRTIAENIAYGDNERNVPMADIIEAAKSANIHDFVSKLPNGYDTGLGSKGASLSGGQKQRIAIARALVRNPKILLLDEATSALDTQSEKVVQAALDKAREGRTCVTIAHRLTTIQNADVICVLENGEVVEKGSHKELMTRGQKYAKLYKMQQVN